MKVALRLLTVVTALICVAPAVWAQDISGAWKGTFNFNDADVPTTVNVLSPTRTTPSRTTDPFTWQRVWLNH